ncbi:oxidoreductase [Paractinoplanes toevensis]|uniref:Short-chain dehydrogenase n=1 Tax=Paractinoplanes toevensis TaxID=571911 RepID=A0A919W3P8_9ACTN|nr:oxidoreductase [Actinoplanes toevensis]GIM93019.1 short-chain dehydrogenase [Actinoplanes toevensis]
MEAARWTVQDVPDLSAKVAVVTGATSGIGREVATALAVRGASVVLAVRDINKGHAVADRIRALRAGADVTVQRLDLASLRSVRDAAGALRARHRRIDMLINNAGVMFTPQQTTEDGLELQLAVNYFGPYALTGLLLDHLVEAPGSRVVTVSSLFHRNSGISVGDSLSPHPYRRIRAYADSKLADLLFTYELHRRLAAAGVGTIAVAAHPGITRTQLARNSPAALRWLVRAYELWANQTPAMGALPVLRAATDPAVSGGQYYGPGQRGGFRGHPVLASSSGRSHDAALQRDVWSAAERLTGVTFPV